MFAFNQLQMGFESVARNFNGLQELLKREDAGETLLKKYKEMNPNAFDQNWSLLEKGKYAAKFYFLEILIAQESVLINLQHIQKESLLNECIQKAQEKEKYPEVYNAMSYRNIGLIAGRIMQIEKFEPLIQRTEADEKLKMFLQVGSMSDTILVKELLNYAHQYLN
jgi:hypothetical protein